MRLRGGIGTSGFAHKVGHPGSGARADEEWEGAGPFAALKMTIRSKIRAKPKEMGCAKARVSLTSVLGYAMLNPQVRLAGYGRRVSGLLSPKARVEPGVSLDARRDAGESEGLQKSPTFSRETRPARRFARAASVAGKDP